MRLDLFLVDKKYCVSRNKAQDMIKNNLVLVNDIVVNKPNFEINDNDEIKMLNEQKYVSRAGLKLEHAINQFNIDVKNKVILDVGSSTGGFADCCIQNGCKKIYCLDVGKNQLNSKIKSNNAVIDLSGINIKDISIELISDEVSLVVSDLSFISSKYMFENIKKIKLSNDVFVISLIKPQFELTKEIISKGKGVVKEKKYHDLAIKNVLSFAEYYGFKCLKIIDSPITGAKMNNKEFLGLFIWKK